MTCSIMMQISCEEKCMNVVVTKFVVEGRKRTGLAWEDSGEIYSDKLNPLVVFGLLSHLWCSRLKMTGLQTTAYKSVIMLYYH